MSEDKVQASGQSDAQPSGSEDKVAYQTYSKVLSEKKKLAEKVGEYEARLAEQESKTLQEQGKYKEIAEAKSKEAEEWKKKATQIATATASHVKQNAIKLKAQELGINPKALEKLPALIDMNEIELEDGFNVNQVKVNEILSKFQTEHDYLFKKTVAPTKDVFPGVTVESNRSDLMKMNSTDFDKLVNEVLSKK